MTIKELFSILIKKWYIILTVTIIFTIGGVLVSKFLIQEKYESVSRSYVTAPLIDENVVSARKIDEKTAALHCVSLSTSPTLYKTLAENLNSKGIGDFSATSLKDAIKVTITMKDLNSVSMVCEWNDPNIAQKILEEFNTVLSDALSVLPFDNQSITMLSTDLPSLNLKKVYPNTMLNTAFAVLLGFVSSIIIILITELSGTKVKNSEDVKNKLNSVLLGEIPTIHSTDKTSTDYLLKYKKQSKIAELLGKKQKEVIKTHTKLVTDENAPFDFKESYNNLAVGLVYSVTKSSGKTICITSAQANSGKSTVAINLAITLAQMGNKVLIVDCDLRKPVFGRYFKSIDKSITPDHVGVTDVLFNNQNLENAMSVNIIYNLSVLYCGTIPPNPQTVLLSTKFKELIKEHSVNYDWIILDTPPINVVADAVIINEICDNSMIVLKNNTDDIKDISAAISKLGKNYLGITLIGNRSKSYAKSNYQAAYEMETEPNEEK